MLAEIKEISGNIELVENTGIQFVDYQFIDNGSNEFFKKLKECYFYQDSDENPLKFLEDVENNRSSALNRNSSITIKDALKLYDGLWFPIPYLDDSRTTNKGPVNWARCRIININKNQDPTNLADDIYRIVLAFDTATQQRVDDLSYLAPTIRDIESGTKFNISTKDLSWFLGENDKKQSWVNEWALSIYNKLGKERLKGRFITEKDRFNGRSDPTSRFNARIHEALYITLIYFLKNVVELNSVHFTANNINAASNTEYVDVNLILDIGNSRSCGIMVEDHHNVAKGDDDFSNTYVLSLRDLNAPEHIYTEPFPSQIEFQEPSFDFDNKSAKSGRPDAFIWPSIARVGTEATNLATLLVGNEGMTGLVSPKRYLWNTDGTKNNQEWKFNSYSYLTDSKTLLEEAKTIHRAARSSELDRALCQYINSNGDAVFSLSDNDADKYVMKAKYSNKSTMTFLLCELFIQAISQMNSVWQRVHCSSKDSPRRLNTIILTVPPAMPAQEKELYRLCVYEALGIVWKTLGYDMSNNRESFKFNHDKENIFPAVPKVMMEWNEAEAGQVVYIYNETQKVYNGRCKDFIKALRRPDADERFCENKTKKSNITGKEEAITSVRIASIDIGGGTSDLVIKDYEYFENEQEFSADIEPREILREGFKVAGDDFLLDIINLTIIDTLENYLKEQKLSRDVINSTLYSILGSGNASDIAVQSLRQKAATQLFAKVGYRILFHLEQTPILKDNALVTGTIEDFLLGNEINENLNLNIIKPKANQIPNQEILNYINSHITKYIKDFDILKLKLAINLSNINRLIVSDSNRVSLLKPLKLLAMLINVYKVDLLLITGRTSKLPCIRSYITQRLDLANARVISMHEYRCEGWYPFKRIDSRIGDPKTTASVGALLSYIRSSSATKLSNFRYKAIPENQTTTLRILGGMDNLDGLQDNLIILRYKSHEDLKRENPRLADDDSNKQGALVVVAKITASNEIDEAKEGELNQVASFQTNIPIDLGYRQIDDKEFSATPIYKICLIDNIEEHPDILNAKNIKLPVLSEGDKIDPKFVKDFYYLDSNSKNELSTLIDKYNNYQGEDINSKRESLLNDLKLRVTAEVNTKYEQNKSGGLFSVFKKGKEEKQKEEEIANLIAQRTISEVDNKLLEEQKQGKNAIKNEFLMLARSLRNKNYELAHEALDCDFKNLAKDLTAKRIPVVVTLMINNNYPYKFIKDEIDEKDLPKVLSFSINKVELINSNTKITDFFKIILKTVPENKISYWTDTGSIYQNN